jgi:hypothetical protein
MSACNVESWVLITAKEARIAEPSLSVAIFLPPKYPLPQEGIVAQEDSVDYKKLLVKKINIFISNSVATQLGLLIIPLQWRDSNWAGHQA